MSNIKFKYDNASKAFKSLLEVLKRNWQTDDVIRDSLIQRFEFTVETSWKLYKAYFERDGLILSAPKPIMKQLLVEQLLTENEVELALDAIDDRNSSSRTYDEKLAAEIAARIQQYIPVFDKLINNKNILNLLKG